MSKVLLLGITGQDGSHLSEILLEAGHQVFGVVRKSSTGNTKNIEHLLDSEYFLSNVQPFPNSKNLRSLFLLFKLYATVINAEKSRSFLKTSR